jgi:putative SOS response-associated peptidase YedK
MFRSRLRHAAEGRALHNRTPLILQPKDYDRWLQPSDPDRPPIDLLRAFPAEQMGAWKVDQKSATAQRYVGPHQAYGEGR